MRPQNPDSRPLHHAKLAAALMLSAGVCLIAALGTAQAEQGDSQPEIGPAMDRYIVSYEEGASLTRELRAQRLEGVEIEDVFSFAIKGFVAELSPDEVRSLRADDSVASVSLDLPVRALGPSATDRAAASWGLDRVDQRNLPLDNRIAAALDGDGVDAYVVDTGIRPDHEEFTGRISSDGFTSSDIAGNWNDCNGHGTHVAGTIGGSTYGIAPKSRLIAVRVLNCSGSGSVSGVIAGLDWIIARHAAGTPAVANLSLGTNVVVPLFDEALERTVADGVSVVVAAGNSSTDACTRSPASAPNVITVGSTDSSDYRSYFSNTGSCLDLFAPGSNITSAWHTSSTAANAISGTSMATPHVAGAAALYLAAAPSASPAQIASAITSDATSHRVINSGTNSPNRLLYIGEMRGPVEPPSISSGPLENTNNSSPSFTFSTPAGTTTECRLDSGPWSVCTSPVSYSALADGTHSFDVRATSQTGATSTTTSRWFIVDTVPPPAPRIDSGPSGLSNNASFEMSGEGTILCRIDTENWNECGPFHSYQQLSQGEHTFRTMARDAAGNTSPVVSRKFIFDSIAPAAPTIVSRPREQMNDPSPEVSFTGEEGASFICAVLQQGKADPAIDPSCDSPLTLTLAEDGFYSFLVIQRDPAGNGSPIQQFSFRLDTNPPSTPQITSGPTGSTSNRRPTFRFYSPDRLFEFECAIDGSRPSRCRSPHTSTKRLGPGQHRFRVWSIDEAGNRSAMDLHEFRVVRK